MTEPRYGRTWEIRLPWDKPPASANDRDHWRVKAAKVRAIRDSASALAFHAMRPDVARDRIDVTLTYVPRDKRRRDADNLVATLKACCDGIVDAGIVDDDTPDLMVKHMPVILPPDGDPRLILTIREVLP